VDECAFPAGYLAAAWADIKDPAGPAVAWVGGMDVDSVNQFIVGFRGGVAHYNTQKNKDVQVLGGHVGSFEDFKGGQQLAEEFLDEGADVVFGVGSLTGNGAIAAAKEYGKWAIGVDTDQFYTLLNEQDIILTSCLKRMDRAVGQVVLAALENQFWGGTRYVGTLANHGVGLAPYHAFEDQLPERLKKEVLDIQRKILEGTLATGWPASK
jgi:basic membrane protein A